MHTDNIDNTNNTNNTMHTDNTVSADNTNKPFVGKRHHLSTEEPVGNIHYLNME